MAVGDIIRAFSGDPKFHTQYYNRNLGITGNKLGKDLYRIYGDLLGGARRFGENIEADTPRVRGIYDEGDVFARGLYNRPGALDTYRSLGDYLFGQIQPNIINPAANFLANQYLQTARARGINPGADSTYERLLRGQIASRSYLDAAGDAYRTLAGSFPSVFQSQLGSDILGLNIAPLRAGAINELAARPLLGPRAGLGAFSETVGAGQGLSDLSRSNVMGVIPQRSSLERWGQLADSLKEIAQQGLSAYFGGAFGGLGGAGGAGAGAGGAGGVGGLSSLFGGGGTGSAGGGMDLSSLLRLFSGGGGATTAQSPSVTAPRQSGLQYLGNPSSGYLY